MFWPGIVCEAYPAKNMRRGKRRHRNTVYYKHSGTQWQRRRELAQPSKISKSKGKHWSTLIKMVIFFRSFQRDTSFAHKDIWTWELYRYCNKKTLEIFLWTGLFWPSNCGQTARLWGQIHWGTCRVLFPHLKWGVKGHTRNAKKS